MKKTIMIFIALLLTILTIGCGVETKKQKRSINPSAEKYLNKFIDYASKNGVSLNTNTLVITFSETMIESQHGGKVIGYCNRSMEGETIVLLGSYWNNASIGDREQLLFHELGHCLLDLDHNDTEETSYWFYDTNIKVNKTPSSIMNKFHFGSDLYNGNRDEYMRRLFTGHKYSGLLWNAPSQIGRDEY